MFVGELILYFAVTFLMLIIIINLYLFLIKVKVVLITQPAADTQPRFISPTILKYFSLKQCCKYFVVYVICLFRKVQSELSCLINDSELK